MKKDLKSETLNRIKSEEIKIRPRSYFKFLKGFLYIATTALVIAAIYIFNLVFYLPLRSLRLAEREGLAEYLSLFPWPLLIVGAVIVGLLIYLYRHHEGGYKKHLALTAIVVFIIVICGGVVIARTNLNEKLENQPRFQRFYQWNEDNFVPRGPRNRLHQPRLNLEPRPRNYSGS